MAADLSPGWYGKLPALGDFANRRLPPLFIEPWDRWLATGLAHWRETDEQWLAAFLAAPTWRFALGPDLPFEGSRGYTGVLMPSVDRVGRYFPLTVARVRAVGEVQAPAPWLHELQACAVAALDGDWDAERFDAELGRLDGEGPPGADWSSWPEWPERGQALWWFEREGQCMGPTLTPGLPVGAEFVRLLSGRA